MLEVDDIQGMLFSGYGKQTSAMYLFFTMREAAKTKAWLAAQPEGRFTFVFTPKHGSWLNLVEGFFSKMARSVLRRIRVASKNELKARILAYLDDLNREPVIHKWTYKIDTVA